MPIKREIVYPVFLECCQHADDTFWENVFEDLAYGRVPYGTYISKDFLCCSYKKREFSYKIEKKDSITLYNEIYEILTKKLGILSQREKIKKRKDFNDTEEIIKESRKNWSDIRKKNTKELLLELYITRVKNQYSLTIKQAKYLLSVIILGMVFKIITSDDINYSDGMITSINGIKFNKKEIIMEHSIYDIDASHSVNIIVEKKSMYEEWDKYIKSIKKLLEK